MRNFRSFILATQFYQAAKTAPVTGDLKDQLLRAASSTCLNLAEGRGRRTRKDQIRHFHIALGSMRESQAVLIIEQLEGSELWVKADQVAAAIYRLIERAW